MQMTGQHLLVAKSLAMPELLFEVDAIAVPD
jgi:hypothetical protein